MGRNDGIRESIQDNSVIMIPGAAQEIRTVPYMAIYGWRHVEIAPRDLERHGIDVHKAYLDSLAGEHGGQGAARTAYHQHMPRTLLQHQAEQGVDIFRQTDAKSVGDALVILRLPIGNTARAVVLGKDDFGGTVPLTSQARLASAATYRPRRNTK